MPSKNILPLVVRTALLVGLLDITGATIHFLLRTKRNPVLIFEYIASSVLGTQAYLGSWWMILLGVLFHFLIAFVFTVIFFLIYPKIHLLSLNRLLTAILYGIFIWLVMNLLVLPLTRVVRSPLNLVQTIIGIGILIVAIGVPLSIIARRFYKVNGEW
ncbi:MAG: hypothetical protein ACJ75B_14325 [Flavisolibacter sp.]